MVNESTAAAIPVGCQSAAVDKSLLNRKPRRTRWVLSVFTFVVVAILGSAWWSNLLSLEEEAYLGRWVAIESIRHNFPKVETKSILIRELEFKPGHEIQLKLWSPLPERNIQLSFPAHALFPMNVTGPPVDSGEITVVTDPHPAILPDSLVDIPPGAEITGSWKIAKGQIHIVWNSNESISDYIKRKVNPYIGGIQIVLTSRKANGTVTRNHDDQLTIQWIKESGKITGSVPPPQVWSRQSD